jgi:DNA-binding XRE family transcriptional regulator
MTATELKTPACLESGPYVRLCRAAVARTEYESARQEVRQDGGKLLRQYRSEAGLTLRQFSELFGVNFTYVSKVENGHAPLSVELASEMWRKSKALIGRKVRA